MLCLDATTTDPITTHPVSLPRGERAMCGDLVLASQSPRRRTLLQQSGFRPRVFVPSIDDGDLRPGAVSPAGWVEALAYLKARAVRDQLEHNAETIVAADTLVVVGDELLGKPDDRADAERMMRRLMDTQHEVLTGVCVLSPSGITRLVDRATVQFGRVGEYVLGEYLDSGEWRGKAGGYNLSERIEAGWPISFDGDATTIMGLPMGKLGPLLREALGVELVDHAA